MRLTPFFAVVFVTVALGAGCYGTQAESPTPQASTSTEQVPPGKNSWPMFGGANGRNMANPIEKDIPQAWSIEENQEKNVKWVAKLGSFAFGGPVVADGKIFIGTNNKEPRDPNYVDANKQPRDLGVMMCFRESDGKFLWQIVHDKLPNPNENDWPEMGICSHPVVEGKRLYYVSNRCELVCAETEGDPAAPGSGKVVWVLDMIGKLKVRPFYMACCSPLIVGDLVYAVTGNGINSKGELPQPNAPSFIAVDKKTGEVKWQSAAPGNKIMEGQWSNPVAAEVNGVTQVVFPSGDGWLYSFEAKSGDLLWKFDCNPKGAKPFAAGGHGTDRNYIVATPVIADNKLYVGVGQQPDNGAGVGHLWCLDITKKPTNKDKDLSPVNDNFDPKADVNKDSGLVWHYGGPIIPRPKKGRDFVFGRTTGTVAIHDGLIYATEIDGFLHCLDAKTGEKLWMLDLKDETWCSPYYVDGKVYVGTTSGDIHVFAAGREPKKLQKIDMDGPVHMPPVAVNGVLYINRDNKLYAIAQKKN
jgi:outer membrane protein assembly factor BamB